MSYVFRREWWAQYHIDNTPRASGRTWPKSMDIIESQFRRSMYLTDSSDILTYFDKKSRWHFIS